MFSTAGVPGSIPAGPEIYAAALRLLGRREDEVHAVDASPLDEDADHAGTLDRARKIPLCSWKSKQNSGSFPPTALAK